MMCEHGLRGVFVRIHSGTGSLFRRDLIKLRPFAVAIVLSICLALLVSTATAQMMFPGGLATFGMSEWGANPSAGSWRALGRLRGAGSLSS